MTTPKIDDRYTEGVWYDGTVGQFYKFNRSDDGTSVELENPITGESVETLDAEEFHNIQGEILPVPEEAIDDPATYFRNWISHHASRSQMDVGRMWAERATEIVEVGEVE